MDRSPEPVWRLDLRPLEYRAAWAVQRELVERRRRGEIPDVLLLTEHPPVFTLGRLARPEHLLAPPSQLLRGGAEVIETDRGGDVTFHGPGQLVAYPIFDLAGWRKDVRAYLRALETVVIETAARFGVPAGRCAGLTGVWCGDGETHGETRREDGRDQTLGGEAAAVPAAASSGRRKLASIGVRVSRWIASHGVALNVATDLAWFSHIVPCGIRGCRGTNLEAEAGRPLSLGGVADQVARAFGGVFARRVVAAPPELAAAIAARQGDGGRGPRQRWADPKRP